MIDFALRHLFLILLAYAVALGGSYAATRALPKGKIRSTARGVFVTLLGFLPLLVNKAKRKIESL